MRRLLPAALALASVVCGQRRVDPRNTYYRVICAVPFTGTGTAADPKRPEYAPWPLPVVRNQMPVTPSTQDQGIIAFTYLPSDDGHYAVAEFVARNRSAFQAIFNDRTLQVFEKGRDSKAAIEAAMQKYRKNFNLDQFGTVMP